MVNPWVGNFHGYSDRETIIGPGRAVRAGEITIRPIDFVRRSGRAIAAEPDLDSFARPS